MPPADPQYVPGAWFAVVDERCAVLVEDSLPAERLAELWAAVRRGEPAESLIDVVSGGRLTGLPSFALVVLVDDGVRVVVRRGVTATVRLPSGEAQVLLGDPIGTWLDRVVDGPATVELSRASAPVTPHSLPFLGGVVLADSVVWSAADPSRAIPASTTEPLPEPFPEVQPAPAPAPAPAAEPLPVTGLSPVTELSPVDELSPEPAPGPVPASQTIDYLPVEGTAVVGSEFDHLFDLTRPATVESAAVRGEDDASGLLDFVPGVSGTDPGPPPPGPQSLAPPSLGTASPAGGLPGDHVVHDGFTVARPAWLASPGGPTDPAGAALPVPEPATRADPSGARPRVLAIRCPDGHPNPTTTQRCRECGASVAFRSPESIPRPSLGILRFDTGQQVRLDQPVLIGRNPTVTRLSGGEIPVIVRVDSTGRDLSRNHAEIRLEDWHVLLVDLGSRNGTVATLPGRAAQLLDPQTPFHLVPGTSVELTDDVHFVFEAPS